MHDRVVGKLLNDFAARVTIRPASSFSTGVWYALAHLNPPATHKYYAARFAVEMAAAGKIGTVTAGTCGNYGRALAYCSKLAGMECHLFVPADYAGLGDLSPCGGAQVTAVPGTYEDAVEASIAHARASGVFDANPTPASGPHSTAGYAQLGQEIADALLRPPTHVWVPVGNGTTLVGIHEGFRSRGLSPAMIAVGSVGNTAATASVRAGKAIDLDPLSLRVTHVNEPLINWHSYHAQETVEAVRDSRGWACDLTDEQLAAAVTRAGRDGVACTPSGGAAVSAFALSSPEPNQVHVLVVTA